METRPKLRLTISSSALSFTSQYVCLTPDDLGGFNKIISGSGSSMETSMESLAKVCLRKGRSSAQLTEITTLGARIVLGGECFLIWVEKILIVWLTAGLKELGGTAPVITQTSMVSTWKENTRVLETESTGIIGRSDQPYGNRRYLFYSSLFSGLSLLPQNDGDED